MKSEIKKLWVDALKSGDYTQATGKLVSEDGYCCLGVLCVVYTKETGNEVPDVALGRTALFLPLVVVTWAGLEAVNPSIEKDETLVSVVNLNDGTYDHAAGKELTALNFNELADLIDEKY